MITAQDIQQYASLLDARDGLTATGKTPPRDLQAAIQMLEHRASASLTPHELQQAQNAVATVRAQNAERLVYAQHHAQEVTEQQAMARALRETTRNMTVPVESVDDLQKISRGETFKQKTNAVRFDKEAHEAETQKRYGVDSKTRMDQLEHVAERLRGGGDATRLMRQYNIDQEALDVYSQHGLAFEMGKRQAEHDKNTPDEKEFTPSYSDTLRADIMIAAAKSGADELLSGDNSERAASRDSMGNDMVGDIAAAWDAVSAKRDTEELQNAEV